MRFVIKNYRMKALILNCTLKRSPAESNTEALMAPAM